MKIRYCLGFLIQGDSVVLIRKTRPPWQAGRLNGVGGHVEKNELPIEAMAREFEEETGVVIPSDLWKLFAVMNGEDWECYCFWASGNISSVQSKTDEPVEIISKSAITLHNTIENIPWLLSMINSQMIDHVSFYKVEYNRI